MALCLQGSLLVRHGAPAVADAFCASRLAGDGGLEYGTLPAGTDFEAIIERSRAGRVAAARRRGRAGPTIQLMPRRGNLQLARIFGIRIGVSGSWFFVLFFLIYWLVETTSTKSSAARSTTAYADRGRRARSATSLSLILHELGHALAARRLGHPGRRASTCGSSAGSRTCAASPRAPGEEFKVAAAGPAGDARAVRPLRRRSALLFARADRASPTRP